MKRLLKVAVALLCAFGLSMSAQTLSVTGSQVVDSTGNPVASATITFTPVDRSGNPISYRMGGKGQTVSTAVSATVTNGSFSITLPDVAHTNPLNVCFAVAATDNVSGLSLLGRGYNCVQPSSAITSWCNSTNCNFDNYVPSIGPFPVVQTGPQGIQGPAGAGYIAGLASDGNNGITVQSKVNAGSINTDGVFTINGNNYITTPTGGRTNFTCFYGCEIDGVTAGATPNPPTGTTNDPAIHVNSPASGISIQAEGAIKAQYVTSGAQRLAPGTDLNTVTSCGNYDVQNPVNSPAFTGGWALVQVVCSADSNYGWQFVYDMDGGSGTYYSRSREYGNWDGWVQR